MMQQYLSNSYLFGGNAPYVEELYENYLANPGSVPDNWRDYFDALQHVPAVDGSSAKDVPHLPVVNAFDSYPELEKDPETQLLAKMLKESFKPFGQVESLDVFTHFKAMHYLKKNKPKALYISYGETDPLGYHVASNPVHMRDFHATLLYLLGMDPHKHTFPFQGLNQKLIGVKPAKVVKGILA